MNMKRLVIFLSISLFLSLGINAQTLSTDTFNSANGNAPSVADTILAPIDVTSIGDVFTITVYYEYDPSILAYVDTANGNATVSKFTISEPAAGLIKILGESPSLSSYMTIPDGKLIDLKFQYVGGNSDLKFHTTDYGTYTSSLLKSDYSSFDFADADVTNGAVEGGYVNDTIDGGDWDVASNWTTGVVPNSWHNVFVVSGSETTVTGTANAHNVTVKPGGQLTVTGTLNVGGDLYIESDASGDGSFIGEGTDVNVTGTTTAERYETDGQWHGFSSPVSGADFTGTFFNDSPFVWVKDFDETTGTYSYLTDTSQVMDDMTGYFAWVQTSTSPVTFTFEGSLRSGTIGSANNMVSNATNSHNFVGNPFTSAIDWDASTGWTKPNLYNAIYVYNGSSWATYIGGAGTNGGSQYIAMGQGFFVEVNTTSSNGTLTLTSDVCVHNTVGYMKSAKSDQQIVRLQIEDNGKTDETVIRFSDEATAGYDGNLDAHKYFSYVEGYPQMFSTANDFMSINSLPFNSNISVPLDVRGQDGNSLTISATEKDGFAFLNLKDNFTGTITDLNNSDYTFTYDSNVSDRFELFFGFTGVDENQSIDYAKIFAVNRNIQVVLNSSDHANITVYNLLGQVVTGRTSSGTITTIPMNHTGYYLVKVDDGSHVTTQKVFIK